MTVIDVDTLFLTVARLTTLSKDAEGEVTCTYATGFFYGHEGGDIFLITNKHVIRDESKNHFPNTIRLSLHADLNNLRDNRDYDISLYNGAKPLWREAAGADVIAIPLSKEQLTEKKLYIRALNSQYLLPDDIQTQIGEDVLVVGYPLGFYYDDVNNLPVIRNGIVASAYPVAYRGKPYFLIDARLHRGTSGSPVFTKSKNSWQRKDGKPTIGGGFRMFLLGINSSTFPLPKEEEPLGLNVVYFASIIDALTT